MYTKSTHSLVSVYTLHGVQCLHTTYVCLTDAYVFKLLYLGTNRVKGSSI